MITPMERGVVRVVHDDLIPWIGRGAFDVVFHGCNSFHRMGAGFAKALHAAYPMVMEADLRTGYGDRTKLGTFSSVTVPVSGGEVTLVNAYTQYFYGSRREGHADITALRSCLRGIVAEYGRSGRCFASPMIGAGHGGLDPDEVLQVMRDEFHGESLTVFTW